MKMSNEDIKEGLIQIKREIKKCLEGAEGYNLTELTIGDINTLLKRIKDILDKNL